MSLDYDLDMAEKLTPKQALFVIEYLKDLNASDAARRSGYSEDTAGAIGAENLKKPQIQEAIQEQMDCRAARTLVTADYVVGALKELAGRCMQARPVRVYDKSLHEWVLAQDEYGNSIWQLDTAGANKALETLGKHLKILTDRTEVGNLDGTNFEFPAMQRVYVGSAPEVPK